jgi:hypothetical protein
MHAVEEALVDTFKLTKWDPAGDDQVTIKQARGGEIRQRATIFSKVSYKREVEEMEGGIETTEIRDWSPVDLEMMELWLTTVDSTLMFKRKGSQKLEPVFVPGMTYAAFVKIYAELPDELTAEWHEKVWEMNPDWNPLGTYLPKEPAKSETPSETSSPTPKTTKKE